MLIRGPYSTEKIASLIPGGGIMIVHAGPMPQRSAVLQSAPEKININIQRQQRTRVGKEKQTEKKRRKGEKKKKTITATSPIDNKPEGVLLLGSLASARHRPAQSSELSA
jgi:hypothetical protein